MKRLLFILLLLFVLLSMFTFGVPVSKASGSNFQKHKPFPAVEKQQKQE